MGFSKDVATGAAGGVAQVVVGQPFDTVKVRMQAQAMSKSLILPGSATGSVDFVRLLVREGGVRSLWAGMSTPLAGISAVNMILFSVQRSWTRMLLSTDSFGRDGINALQSGRTTTERVFKSEALKFAAVISGGAVAGASSAVVMGPVELVKTLVQVPHADGSRRKPVEIIRRIAAQEGVRGFFRGTLSTALREGVGNGFFFGGNALARKSFAAVLDVPEKSVPFWVLPLCGSAGGISFWISAYPLDVIKTRLQLQQSGTVARYRGWVHCAATIFKEEGARAFFTGLSPAIVRCIPVGAGIWTAVDLTSRKLDELFPE